MKHKLTLLIVAALLVTGEFARADLLPNNFWVNPTFESGINLDQTDGTVSNWNREQQPLKVFPQRPPR